MLISRHEEKQLLNDAVSAKESQFIAVYGRRRVGKTYLVREVFHNRFTFQHAGLANEGTKQQLRSFSDSLEAAGLSGFDVPKDWLGAFTLLKELTRKSKDRKKIIFIDELSWMDAPKSDLMAALENFWNVFASARKDVVLIICASATSWMLDRVIHNRGGLYNRLTDRIHLKPFTLCECAEYVSYKGLVMSRDQIMEAYMILGGIPFYWSLMKKGRSLAQNIDEMIFSEDAYLKEEFYYLFASLFKRPENYIRIIAALAKKKGGLTRNELADDSKLSASGNLTRMLSELENCGFIRKYAPYGSKKKGTLYQLTDNFTLFYFQFMEKNAGDPKLWSHLSNSPKKNVWAGLAFERLCLLHTEQIKKALGISGVQTEFFSWQCKEDKDRGLEGSQIDLLMVRKDQVINLCEMKYSQKEYAISKSDHHSILAKINDFQLATGTKASIHVTLVTSTGLKANSYSNIVQKLVVGSDLFEKQ
ncbi:MAG: ATP-binding protein [Lachnospiraceae bacterium]|nr:ATP-binding protein [Lachnospiraceae bacterium]